MTAKAARAQGALAIASLFAAVAVTVMLVATPVSSRPAAERASASAASRLPTGIKVEIRGGDPYVAFGLADRLAGAGASLHAVQPAADGNPVEPATMIVYYERGQQASAERVRALLGQGTLRHRSAFEPGVDVTIVLGKDLSRL